MTESLGQQGGGILQMLLMFGAMFAIFYFVLIRPQQKQQKRHQQLIAGLKKGDEIILSSGIIGRIFSVDEKFITMEIGDKTRMKVLRQAVSSIYSSATESEAKSDEQKAN